MFDCFEKHNSTVHFDPEVEINCRQDTCHGCWVPGLMVEIDFEMNSYNRSRGRDTFGAVVAKDAKYC